MAEVRIPGGILIAVEGIDGAGKTTQVDRLCDHLRHAGFKVTRSKEPTNGPHGQRIRDSAASGRLSPDEELETLIKDRREHVASLINPALADGQVVVVDRYYLSTVAYQGARGLDPARLLELNESFAPQPDIFVLIEITPKLAMQRIRERGEPGRNEFEQEHLLEKCAEIFASIERPYILRLDGNLTRDELQAALLEAIDRGPLFRKLCRKPHLEACQPFYCEYRLSGECPYPGLEMGRPRV